MAKQGTYNGWPNRETWNVMLWMDNDESAYRYYVDAVRTAKGDKKYFGGTSARDVVESIYPEQTPDGIRLDSTKIRWGRIAEAMRESS